MGTPTGAAHARRRFSLIVGCFALANLLAWVAYIYWMQPQRNLLRVEAFEPGEAAEVSPLQALRWRFNLEVAPPVEGQSPGQLTPAVEGRWEWPDARTLLFVPEAPLAPATRYTVELSPRVLRTADDFRLAEPVMHTVMTAPLRVRDVRQVGMAQTRRFLLEFTFSDRVLPADLQQALRLHFGGQAIGFELHGEATGNVLRVLTDTLPDASGQGAPVPVEVELAEGLAGTSGPLGLQKPYRTQVPIAAGLACTGARAYTGSRGAVSIYLDFNGEANPEALREVLSIDPPVAFTIGDRWSGSTLRGDFQPATRYAITFKPPSAGTDPTRYPRPGTVSVFVPDREASVWFEHGEGYLGAHGNRTLLAHAVNVPQVEARLWRVYDNNIVAWRNAGARGYGWRDPQSLAAPIGRKVIGLAGRKNVVEAIRVDLDDLLPADAPADGVYRVTLRAVEAGAASGDGYRWDADAATAVVTLSDIGLTAKQHGRRVTVWAVSLDSAEPLSGVRVRLYSNKNQLLGTAVTDADGLATVEGKQPAEGEMARVVLADRVTAPDAEGMPVSDAAESPQTGEAHETASAGLTWLDIGERSWDLSAVQTGGRPYLRKGLEAMVYVDRGVYRPGETVQLRAIVRNRDGLAPQPFPLRWQLRRPDQRNWRSEVAMPDRDGSVGWTVQLPDDLVTGRWTVHLGLPGEKESLGESIGRTTFLIEEFLPDRMKVAVTIGEPREHAGAVAVADRIAADSPAKVRVQADYLFGQPAAGLSAEVRGTLEPSSFEPSQPRWRGWSFGDAGEVIDATTPPTKPSWIDTSMPLTLDAQGGATWMADLSAPAQRPRSSDGRDAFRGPWRLVVSAGVSEPGGRAVTGWRAAQVDALPWYIGLRCPQSITPGSPASIEVALAQPDGSPAVTDVEMEVSLFRVEWNTTMLHKEGRYHFQSNRVLEPVADAVPPVLMLRNGQGAVPVTISAHGQYIIRVRDPQSGAMSSIGFYCAEDAWEGTVDRANPERLDLVLLDPAPTISAKLHPLLSRLSAVLRGDEPARAAGRRHSFAIGERPRVLVRSPFAGRLLLSVETDRIVRTQVIDMPASQVVVPIGITDDLRPNAYVSATVVRGVEPDLKWRTHRAYGAVRLGVDPGDRRLDVTLEAPAEMRPGSPLEVMVQVDQPSSAVDVAGSAAGEASLTIAAVDEGILQLTDFVTPDPLGFFHAARALGVKSWDLYGLLMPEVPRTSAPGGDDEVAGNEGRYRSPVAARRIHSVALFSGPLKTDVAGRARVHFDVPPAFAGKLRLMAVVHQAERFGSAEQHVLVRSPLIVQSSYPRFVAPGDRFDLSVTVFNNTESDGQARIEVHSDDEQLLTVADNERIGAAGDKALSEVARGDQVRVGIACAAGQQIGIARLRLVVNLGDERFEEQIELPVRPPSPAITRGGYLAAKPGAPARIEPPADVLGGTASFQVRLTPWPALQLPEGLDYLDRYPHGCAEQTISACFPLVYLGELGPRIAPGLFDRAQVAAKLQHGIYRLIGMQTSDGGIAMWGGSRRSWPWASIYAAHLIVEAEKAGHAVPADFRDSLLAYVRRQLETSSDAGDALERQAYAAYVMALAGKPQRAAMNRLVELLTAASATNGLDEPAQRAQARLYVALAWMATGREDLAQGLLPPPRALPLPRDVRQSGGNLGSPIRDRAMLVRTLVELRPDDPELPALVQQLADSGRGGHWRSTQDCAMAVMAIGSYLKHQPTGSGETYASADLRLGDQVLAMSRTPGAELGWQAEEPLSGILELAVTGGPEAMGHVSWLLNGVPTAPPAAVDNGMRIRRVYTDRDGRPLSGDRVASGQLVRVELWVEAPRGTENVVIEDLLPAGLEIENPRLETSAAADDNGQRLGPGTAAAFDPDSVDIRDDRIVVVGAMPNADRARYVYLARAVTAGTYTVPPVRAECMYDIAMNSLHGSGRLVVEPVDRAELVELEAGR